MREIVVASLLAVGAIAILISAIGLLRMPDIYTRLSTTTKANTLGIGAMLLATSFFFSWDVGVLTRLFTAFIAMLITIPVSGHFLARVAYFIGFRKSERMKKDELQNKFASKKGS